MSCVHRNELPTGSEALPAPENVDRSNGVGIVLVPAGRASELRLRPAVFLRYAPADGTRPTGVLRRYRKYQPAEFGHLGVEEGKEHSPSLIQNRTIQTALLLHVPARFLHGPA